MPLYLSVTSFVSSWIGILKVTELLLGVILKMCYVCPAKAKLRIGIMFSLTVLLLKEFGRFGGLYVRWYLVNWLSTTSFLNGIDGDWFG